MQWQNWYFGQADINIYRCYIIILRIALSPSSCIQDGNNNSLHHLVPNCFSKYCLPLHLREPDKCREFLWKKRCLVNSAQNQLGPILTWPKTNSAQLNNQLGPRYVPTRPKHDSCLFLYYFLPFLTPICLSIWFFSFFHELDYRMASRYL